MIQQKTFKLGDDEAINAFLLQYPPLESTGLQYRAENVIVVYEDERGYTKAARDNKLRLKICSIDEQLLEAEVSFRSWSAAILFKPGNSDFQNNLTQAKQLKEGLEMQMRILKNMLHEDLSKSAQAEPGVPQFMGKKDYSETAGKKEAAKAEKKLKNKPAKK